MSTETLINEQGTYALPASDENFVWQGRPVFVPFVLTPVINTYLFFQLIGIFFYFITRDDFIPLTFFMVGGLFFAIIVFLGQLYTFRRTDYAFSENRLISCSGEWETTVTSVDLDNIAKISVSTNPLEKLLNAGTITLTLSGSTLSSMVSVKDPHTIYRTLEKLSLDFKSDLHYPNANRPNTNPGYKTQYRPEAKNR